MKRISVIGLGWLGAPLAKVLMDSGYDVSGTTRSKEKQLELEEQNIRAHILNYPGTPSPELLHRDIVILNIPPFEDELQWFKSWPWNKQAWLIFVSSISVLDRKSPLNAQEDWIRKEFPDWTILRLGGLLGDERHPGKHLSGRKNLPGRLWPVNLIHRDDCIGVVKAIIRKDIKNETFDVVANEHPTREKFYTEYCLRKGLPLPLFDPSDLSVREALSNEKLLPYYNSFRPLDSDE